MAAKKCLFLFAVILLFACDTYAQDDFCNAVNAIIRDAPNRFRDIKGKQEESNMNVVTYDCGITVPGTIASRFVVSMGFFYEGALLQTHDMAELKPLYDKYKTMLVNCLQPQGYTLSATDNFYPGLSEFKKIVLMPALKDGTAPDAAPAHVALEATYNKDIKTYTLVMYIFEH